MSRSAGPSRVRKKTAHWSTVVGGLLAILVAEPLLRVFSTPRIFPTVNVLQDSGDTRGFERRQYLEGVATSHFSAGGARSNGRPRPATGDLVLLLGDSYVAAIQVGDSEHMGAALNELEDAQGHGIRIVQYGWSGADIPTYVLQSKELLERWSPRWVVVVVTEHDFEPDLLSAPIHLVRDSAGRWSAVGVTPWEAAYRGGKLHQLANAASSHSALLYRLLQRATELTRPGDAEDGASSGTVDSLPPEQRVRIGVEALHASFGAALRIAFLADVGLDGARPPRAVERALFEACAAVRVPCANSRRLMRADRLDSLRLSRGFVNSAPGVGHLNAVGHRLAARTIAELLVP